MFRIGLAVAGGIAAVILLGWIFLFAGRPMAIYQEETRQRVYETSVTGQTACQAELLRLYTESLDESLSDRRRRALELQALNEYNRARCNVTDPDVRYWMEEIPR